MNSARLQHLIPGTLVLLLGLTVVWLSFTREPAESFLFPRLISVVMLALAFWNFVRAATGLAKVGTGFTASLLVTIAPGVAVMIIFIFFLAKQFGFYVSSTIAFVAIYAIYDPAPHSDPKSWAKRVGVAVAFMVLMYGLFSILLKVQTPRGMFF